MSIHPNTGIGHVHLTVSDLDRALAFYRDVLGFDVTSRYGRDAVFLSAGGYHQDRKSTRLNSSHQIISYAVFCLKKKKKKNKSLYVVHTIKSTTNLFTF